MEDDDAECVLCVSMSGFFSSDAITAPYVGQIQGLLKIGDHKIVKQIENMYKIQTNAIYFNCPSSKQTCALDSTGVLQNAHGLKEKSG